MKMLAVLLIDEGWSAHFGLIWGVVRTGSFIFLQNFKIQTVLKELWQNGTTLSNLDTVKPVLSGHPRGML